MRRIWVALITVLLSTAVAADERSPITVFAAVSLTDVLQAIGAVYTATTGTPVRYSFAASSALARQIESGANVDVFVSADQEWMDYLEQRGLIDRSTRRNIVANRLALVAPADSAIQLKIAPGFRLAEALGTRGRLAAGDPDSVPAGKYAKEALTSLGVWPQIESRLVRAENVRTALAFVSRGEVPLGIVYETDAKADGKVKVIDVFPAASHSPIEYPVAALKNATPAARAFVAYLSSPASRKIFQDAGFTALPAPQ